MKNGLEYYHHMSTGFGAEASMEANQSASGRPAGRRRAEASRYLIERWGLSYVPTTLARMASLGTGPVYSYHGKFATYQDDDLDAFARSKLGGRRRKASEPLADAMVA
jgi:hypothetical protein